MWKARTVYSLLGQMRLSSLYDDYPEETVSITHFKSRIETIMKTYLELYPNDLNSVFLADSNDSDTEYLRMEPPFTNSYWINRPYNNKGISIMRSGMMGAQIYYLYQYDGKDLFVHQLTEWQTADSAYRSLSNACLYVN